MSASHSPPSPMLFFDTATAYQRSAAIRAAVELDLFSAIGGESRDVATLAAATQASLRGLRILCDYLTILGFLTKEGAGEGEGRYRLTSDSALFLDRRSPAYLGSAVEFLCSPLLLAHFADPAKLVRQGSPIDGPLGTMAPEHPVWVQFARAMAPMTVMPAQLMAGLVQLPATDATGRRPRLLDIAAGHGIFGITMAQRHPTLEVTACDWPQVLELAQENAHAAGVAERWRKLPGSAFDVELGDGYDLVLLTNFLHHFDPATCEKLLRKLHGTLLPGGRLVTIEMVPNADRVTPAAAAAFAFTMLASTPGGDAYPFAELDGMLQRSGFGPTTLHPLPGGLSSILISQRQ